MNDLKKTPLYDTHCALGARMVPFGGWHMPVQYAGILKEYQQTRNQVSIFDISHMGELRIKGDCVKTGLDYCVTFPLQDLPVKSCRYGFILNENGGIVDDLIIFREDVEDWFLVVNAATTEKDKNHLKKHLSKNILIEDISLKTGKLDIQGPLSRDVLSGFISEIKNLNYYSFDFFKFLGQNLLISRTGYTGELGYEIFCPWEQTTNIWQAFLKNDHIKPAGLGARDILRLEMGYSLYGHELNDEITPLEAGLMKFVDFNKVFIGRDALLKQKESGQKRKMAGLISFDRRTPRAGHQIFSKEKVPIGVVTSGVFSPYLEKGIGLALLELHDAKVDTEVFFGDQKNVYPGRISKRLFYEKGTVKS